jgi:hypothetical protein
MELQASLAITSRPSSESVIYVISLFTQVRKYDPISGLAIRADPDENGQMR